MAPSFSCSRIKQYLFGENNRCIVLVIIFAYILGIILTIIGLEELYTLNTFVVDQCRIKSIDFKFISPKLHPRWNVTVIYQNQTTNQSIMDSKGFTLENDAWEKAQRYKVNQTYPCYRSEDQAFFPWTWRWDKPSRVATCSYLISGVPILFITTMISISRRSYQTVFRNTPQQQQQQQIEMSLRSEEQQCPRTPLESPPPSYEEAVQRSIRLQTRT